jgi:hypothetical protein
LADGEILEFPRDRFLKFAESRPWIAMKVYRGMAEVLASRMASNDQDLMDAIIWALGHGRNSPSTPNLSAGHKSSGGE